MPSIRLPGEIAAAARLRVGAAVHESEDPRPPAVGSARRAKSGRHVGRGRVIVGAAATAVEQKELDGSRRKRDGLVEGEGERLYLRPLGGAVADRGGDQRR